MVRSHKALKITNSVKIGKNGKLSDALINKMKLRDEFKTRAKLTNDIEDWNAWKRLKNEVNKDVRKEKNTNKENEIKSVGDDTTAKGIWRFVKQKACWLKSLAPTALKYGDTEYTTSPSKMATVLNEFFYKQS